MQLYRDWKHLPDSAKGCAVAIGNFEGVHCGHQAIIARLNEHAAMLNAPTAMMSFEPHPRQYFQPQSHPLRLTRIRQKLALFEQYGISHCFLLRFHQALAQMSAAAFIEDILINALKTPFVMTGDNFRFGEGRKGNAALLKEYAAEGAFAYEALPPVLDDSHQPYSSTRIREALRFGEIAQANALLGRPFSVEGRVITGDQRGRTIGFPTANIKADDYWMPRHGVYAVRLEDASGTAHAAIANWGVRPTVDGVTELLEVHLLDADIHLYGQRVSVAFHHFIRGEQHFDGLEALKQQIALDSQQARDYWSQHE